MTWLSFFLRVPALAVATPFAIVAAILIAAIFGYRLEIDAIGLRFDRSVAPVSLEAAQR